jgi:phage gp36-like protein
MAYSARADLDTVFGSDNIDEWADLNNNDDAGEITAAVTNAIAVADAYINGRLRGTHYTLDLADASGSTPALVTRLSATLAGITVHDWRGIEDGDNLESHRGWVEKMLAEITAGTLRLDAV